MKEYLFSIFIKLNDFVKETDYIDFFYILSLILIAISLFAIAYILSRFLSIWNRELKYQKKVLLASRIMETVYDIENIISKIRDPFYFPSEEEEILQSINKYHYLPLNEEKIKYLVPFYRIKKYQCAIDNFKKLRWQAQLYWKDEVLVLFKNLLDIIERIESSSKTLYEYSLPKEEVDKIIKNIWNTKELDVITPQVQTIVKEFKINLEKLYKPKRKVWKQIKK